VGVEQEVKNMAPNLQDVAIYARLARQAGTKKERDYHIMCAVSLLERSGVDTSLSDDPNVALLEIERQVHEGKCTLVTPGEKPPIPYQDFLMK